MANLNVRRLTPFEAQRIRGAAAAHGETMKEYVLASGALRADLEQAARALLEAGRPVPACPVAQAAEADPAVAAAFARHLPACPVCTAGAVQRALGNHPGAGGWAELARAVGVRLEDLAELRARMGRLPEREREVLVLLYGLDGRRRIDGQAAARAMGVSRERARQLAERGRAVLSGAGGARPSGAAGAVARGSRRRPRG